MKRAILLCLVAGTASSIASANDINWAAPVDGFWNTAANWSPATVPTAASDVAILGLSGPYTVNLNLSPSIDGLSITNPEAVFELTAGRTMTLGSSGVFNDGWIIVNPTSVGFTTSLTLNQPATIDGSGLLTLNSAATTARINSTTDALMTHGVDHTINGFGQIALRFDNLGYIAADSTGNTLNIIGGQKSNSGVMAATDGGIMQISNTIIDQSAGGFLEAAGGEVSLSNSAIIGGFLLNSGDAGSLLTFGSNSSLEAVTVNGDSQQPASANVSIGAGSLVNNGTWIVNPTSVGFTTSLGFTGSTVIGGNGTIRLNGPGSNARMVGAGIGVENGADHSIRGYGQILVDLINSGVVAADRDGQVLELSTGNKTNLSTMRAEDGGELRLANTTVTQSASGEVIADGGLVNLAASTVVVGGSLRNLMSPDSNAIVSGTTTLEDVTIEGDWAQNAGVTLTLLGTTVNEGTYTLNSTSIGFLTTINFPQPATLAGSGTLRLNGVISQARVNSASGQQFTQDAGHSIRGFGQISALMLNNGMVAGDVAGEAIRIDGQTKVNNSVFRAENSGGLEIQNTTVDQTGGGIIEADGGSVQFTSATVIGGTIRNSGSSGSSVAFASNTLQSCTFDGNTALNAGSNLVIAGGLLTNNGVLTVNMASVGFLTSLSSSGATQIDGTGVIRLNATGSSARLLNSTGDLLTLGSGQTLSGVGQIAAATQIDGTLSPGLGIGTMTGNRPVTLGDTAAFACEFNDSGVSDLYQTSSTITLDGTLDISFVDGYTASAPEAFTIITTGTNGVTGRFDQITGDAPPAPLITRVLYESNRVRVGFTCIGDANLDGSTDLDDLNAILTNFGTGSSLGDLNDDGIVDLDDLNIVLTNFGSDCP